MPSPIARYPIARYPFQAASSFRRHLSFTLWTVTLWAVLLTGLAGALGAATLTDSGSTLTIDLAASEQITASSDGSTYTLVSNQTFVDGGVAAPGADFSGFGTTTLTVEASGLTRYFTFRFTDAGNGADLVFASGSGSWQDSVLTEFDGTGSRVANSGSLTTVAPLQWAAESLEIGADITGDTVQFDSPVSLTATAEVDGVFNVIFNSTLDGAHGLTLGSPVVLLEGVVGGTTPLASLSVGAAGSTDLGPSVSTSGTQSYANAASTAAGGTVLRAGDLVFSGPSVSGTGTLGIAPADPADSMAVGTASPTGGLHLDDAEIALLADGFSGLELGRVDATGLLTVDSATFLDALTLRGGEVRVEGIVEVDGDLTVEGELVGGAAGLTPGSDYGQLRVLGAGRTATLGAGSLAADAFDFSSLLGDAVTLVDLDEGTSAVSGTFAGLAEGAAFRCGIVRCAITYVGGDGNDVVVEVSSVLDFGDAPDSSAGTGAGDYQTLLANDGPRHDVGPPIHLGPYRDAEPDGFASATATGDDLDPAAPSDEDGLAIGRIDLDVTTGASHTVVLNVTNDSGAAATVSGWIDHDRDGVFDNATERAQATVPDGTIDGTATLTFPAAPSGSATNSTFARFRISTDPAAENPTGAASDGEVEDYRVRIFEPTGGRVNSRTDFASELGASGDEFGAAIVDVGDVDGDGVGDLVVGKPSADSGNGQIEVLFMQSDGQVRETTQITTGLGNEFGISIAPLGDLDGDGVPDVAVGEPRHATGRGRVVLVFLDTDGTAKQMIFHQNPVNATLQRFGAAVASVGDLDGDGTVDLAVGAPRNNSQRGSVTVLFLAPDGGLRSHTIIASGVGGGPSLDGGDNFGTALAALGDLDGDGVRR